MNRKAISWILEYTSKLPREEQIKCLRANAVQPILTVLKYCFDPNIKWALPEGEPPYEVTEEPHRQDVLYTEARKLYLFIEGGNPNLKPLRREFLFVDLLQKVDPNDAKLLISIKDKVMPYPGLEADVVKEAFPDLW